MENQNNKPNMQDCGYKNGSLPKCAPLAASYVPMQGDNSPTYEREEALTRGTLFPGLDLPFMNNINKSNPYAGTPLGELMSLQFVIKELQLYLDTHREDMDAFKALQDTISLYLDGKATYSRLYGPITITDMEHAKEYTWVSDPWPWDFAEREGAR